MTNHTDEGKPSGTVSEDDKKRIAWNASHKYVFESQDNCPRTEAYKNGAEEEHLYLLQQLSDLRRENERLRQWKDSVMNLKVADELDGMLKSDRKLYEKILDTVGFSFHFNNICNIAQRKESDLTATRKLLDDMAEALRKNMRYDTDAEILNTANQILTRYTELTQKK